jgi:hypothetical protein
MNADFFGIRRNFQVCFWKKWSNPRQILVSTNNPEIENPQDGNVRTKISEHGHKMQRLRDTNFQFHILAPLKPVIEDFEGMGISYGVLFQ